MLIVTTKKNENVLIGDMIRVYVLDMYTDRVKLGIEVPPNMTVQREETYKSLQEEKKSEGTRHGALRRFGNVLWRRSLEAILITGGLSGALATDVSSVVYQMNVPGVVEEGKKDAIFPELTYVIPEMYH